MTVAALSWDELSQVLLFLPASDVCHYSQTNSTAYGCILSNQDLWSVLLQRDFASIIEQLKQPQTAAMPSIAAASNMVVDQACCDEMKNYVCYYVRFYQFPFDRVEDRSMYDEMNNHTISKVLFGVASSPLNLLVMNALKNGKLDKPQNEQYPVIGVDFMMACMASRQPKVTPNLTIQLWQIGPTPERFRTISRAYYRGAQCMVITVDTQHAWQEDYSTDHPYSSYGPNSLSRALAALKESQPALQLVPPRPCKGVLIVGVGVWSEEAPISKQRFLNDCARVFDILPLEYFELTGDNAPVMSDIIIRRFYAFHQQAALEDPEMVSTKPKAQHEAPQSRCILS